MLELLLVIQITQSIFSIKAAGRSLEQESVKARNGFGPILSVLYLHCRTNSGSQRPLSLAQVNKSPHAFLHLFSTCVWLTLKLCFTCSGSLPARCGKNMAVM